MENTASTASPTAEASEAVEATAEKVAETPAEKPSSSKILDFARKEAEFAKKEVARKEEIAKLQEQLAAYENDIQFYKSARETYKSNPEAILQKLGISYDELTEAVIDYYDRGGKDKVETLDRDAVRKEIEAEFQKKENERLAKETTAAVETFVKEIGAFVEREAGSYPHLTALARPLGETESPEELIFSVVENYFAETGQMLSLEEAARVSEEYLREEWEKLNGSIKPSTTPPATATPAAPSSESEKIVAPAKEEGAESLPKVNATAFKHKDYAVTNKLSTKSYVPYKNKSAERMDIIEKAVAAMEAASRRNR